MVCGNDSQVPELVPRFSPVLFSGIGFLVRILPALEHLVYHSEFLLLLLLHHASRISSLAQSCLRDLPDVTSPTARFVLESMRIAVQNCYPYPSDSGLFDAFWHTLVAGKDHPGIVKAPFDFAEIFALLLDSASGTSPSMPNQPTPNRRLTLDNLKIRRPSHIYRRMQASFTAAVKGRTFGTTSRGYMGLFPRGTKIGDQICVFIGGHIPFTIRPQTQGTTGSPYQLVGECYVHGIMDGEVMLMTDLQKEEIRLA